MSETYPERTFAKRFSQDILPPAYDSVAKVVKKLQVCKKIAIFSLFSAYKLCEIRERRFDKTSVKIA